MKIFYKIVKKLCIGIFSIYSVNILFSTLNICIPINLYTIGMSSFLGLFGLASLIVMNLFIK
ncbi:MAG: pro-sigmaK processing inhibitor BofA family protein [Bacilli bacterium]|nr:pro-sigmaK processing inhibitor BofA family protein [Bacilli bacterium]